jgi:predicted amidophosphoribosyltransferase
MPRDLDLYGDDVANWCDSCGAPLEDDDQTLCDECDPDEEDEQEEMTLAQHCREETLDDVIRQAKEESDG